VKEIFIPSSFSWDLLFCDGILRPHRVTVQLGEGNLRPILGGPVDETARIDRLSKVFHRAGTIAVGRMKFDSSLERSLGFIGGLGGYDFLPGRHVPQVQITQQIQSSNGAAIPRKSD